MTYGMLASASRHRASFAYHLARDSWLDSVVTKARVDLPRTAEAPRIARRCVQHEVGAELDHPEREIVEIMITELVSNAVRHAGSDGGENVILHFAVAPERIRVEVCDRGAGFTADKLTEPRSGPGGYGLLMVDRGASRWGASGEDGNCVWFELDRRVTGG